MENSEWEVAFVLVTKYNFSKVNALNLMFKHYDTIQAKISNDESADDIALALYSCWLDEENCI